MQWIAQSVTLLTALKCFLTDIKLNKAINHKNLIIKDLYYEKFKRFAHTRIEFQVGRGASLVSCFSAFPLSIIEAELEVDA